MCVGCVWCVIASGCSSFCVCVSAFFTPGSVGSLSSLTSASLVVAAAAAMHERRVGSRKHENEIKSITCVKRTNVRAQLHNVLFVYIYIYIKHKSLSMFCRLINSIGWVLQLASCLTRTPMLGACEATKYTHRTRECHVRWTRRCQRFRDI